MRSRTLFTIVTLLPLLALLLPMPAAAGETEKDRPQWRRDPFHYVPLSQTTRDRIKEPEKGPGGKEGLEGIMSGEGSIRALFNGQVVSEGDRVDGVLIRRITPYFILVEDASGPRRIDLFHD